MATELLSDIDSAAAEGAPASSILTGKMMGAVSGHNWNKSLVGGVQHGDVVTGGTREMDADEHTNRAMRAELAMRKAIKQGINSPRDVIKGLNPAFMAEYGLFLNDGGRTTPLESFMSEVGAELGKNFTTASPLASGLVPFDLEAPSKLIYWFETVLRAKIPRVKGQGTSHRTKVITGISGSQTGAAGGIIDHSLGTNFDTAMNLTGAAGTFPSIPPSGSQSAVDLNIPYKFFGLSESLSWLAQFAGQGFEDIAALANLVLMQEMHFADEYMMIGGSAVALVAPSVALTVRAAGAGETGITFSSTDDDLSISVTAANYFGQSAIQGYAVAELVTSGVNVVDVVITPAALGAVQQWNIYGSTATEVATATTVQSFIATVGGTKYTVQGAVPLASSPTTRVAPTATSGTNGANRFEGLLSVLSGQAANGLVGANGYPAGGFQAGYVNLNVQDTLNINVINNALQMVYNGPGAFRASPTECLCDGADAKSLSTSIAGGIGTTSGYELKIDQNQMAGVVAGTAVSQIVNPVTRRLLDITVHPGWLQGTAALMSWTTPNAVRNSNAFEMVMVQDLLSVAWPVIDPSYRFSMFEFGAMVAHAPQYSALLGGLQKSAVGPWS